MPKVAPRYFIGSSKEDLEKKIRYRDGENYSAKHFVNFSAVELCNIVDNFTFKGKIYALRMRVKHETPVSYKCT